MIKPVSWRDQAWISPEPLHHVTIIQHQATAFTHGVRVPMWQTQSVGPVRTAHISVLLTVNIVSHNPAHNGTDNIPSYPPDIHHNLDHNVPFSQDRPHTSHHLLTLIIRPDQTSPFCLTQSVTCSFHRQGRRSQSLQVRSSYDLELYSTKYQATTIHWLFQMQYQNSPRFPPRLAMFPTLLYASASDSSSLEFVLYINAVIIIIIIIMLSSKWGELVIGNFLQKM